MVPKDERTTRRTPSLEKLIENGSHKIKRSLFDRFSRNQRTLLAKQQGKPSLAYIHTYIDYYISLPTMTTTTSKDDTTVPLPPAAQGARALLSMAFGWVFLRGYQLRGDLLSPPPGEDEMMHFSSTDFMSATPNRQLRGIVAEATTQGQLFDKKEHSAACLLIQKDDFHLSGWLAYHTFMAPLDYLVVATDPPNRPIPSDLLDMYQKEVGMVIVEWNDSNYYNNGEHNDKNSTEFLSRPQQFKQTCALHMQSVKRNWVTYHDSDEYIMNNHPLSSSNNDVVDDATQGSGETRPSAPEWMDQFVNHHGKEKANRLLGGELKAVVV